MLAFHPRNPLFTPVIVKHTKPLIVASLIGLLVIALLCFTTLVKAQSAPALRDISVPVFNTLEGTVSEMVVTDVPEGFDIPLCQLVTGALVCVLVENGVSRSVLIPIETGEV